MEKAKVSEFWLSQATNLVDRNLETMKTFYVSLNQKVLTLFSIFYIFINELFSGVKFDLFSKVTVNGENAHPLWKYLKSQQGGFLVDGIKWNFTKFLIDQEGQVVERYAPTTSPTSMVEDIERLFSKNAQTTTKGEL